MSNDTWQTPAALFAAFNKRFKFGIDLAADSSNAKCEAFVTAESDALSYKNWAGLMELFAVDWAWLNPPYSNPRPFVETAIETQKAGKGVVMLLNNDPSIYWYRLALESCSEVWHFTSNLEKPRTKGYKNGRIGFVDPSTGNPSGQNNKPQCAFVFDPHRIGDCQTRYVELKSFMNS